MAIDSEPKRWSMLAFAGPMRTHVFNPDTSGLVSIEKITVLQHYGGIAWDNPVASTASKPPSGLALMGVGT
jgi:hypothetical protein